MTLPGKVATQLHAVLKKDAGADRIALVWPQPPDPPEADFETDGVRFRVVFCPSELAMREQLVAHRPDGMRLVLLTPLDDTRLARDLLARIWRNNPLRLSPWRTLQDLLGVRQIDPRLARHQWMAEALLGCYEHYHERIGATEVLDLEGAWRALAIALLDYDAPQNDLRALLDWSLKPGAQGRFDALPSGVREHLGDWLGLGAGRYAPLVLALLEEGHGDELLAVGLAAQVLYHPAVASRQEVFLARGRFSERFFGGRKIAAETLGGFGDEAGALTRRLVSEARWAGSSAQMTAAERILAALDALDLAVVSDLLPRGFDLRLERLAKAMQQALETRAGESLRGALAEVRRHGQAALRPERVDRAAMGARLIQWLQAGEPLEAGDPRQAIRRYAAHGGFIDWARSRIWAGDENEALDRAYQAVTRQVTERRERANRAFSGHLPAVAGGDAMGPEVLPVESLLECVLAPLAKDKPILLVVMDGMSQAVYEELADDLIRKQWVEYRDGAVAGPRSLLAVLPSVTRLSRASLLAGALSEGTAADEKRRFARHPSLKGVSSSRFPPLLFHKADLIQTGGGGLAGPVREVVAGREHRVVAVVINAVDDLLSGGAQLAVSWDVDRMHLFRQVLEAARESGRTLVITSDHGHVIDHDMKYRPSEDTGERYRENGAPPGEDECRVAGPRVLNAAGAAVLPWSEKVRYGAGKLGYHGGGSLQEVVIPLGVFLSAPDQEIPAGWREVPRDYPDWWRLTPGTEAQVPEPVPPPAASPGRKRRRPEPPTLPDLFDQAPTAAPGDDWIAALWGSAVLARQRSRLGRLPISDERLRVLLGILARSGGQIGAARLAQDLELPRIRLAGFLSGVRRLLNVDGYAVLSEDREGGTVTLNIDLLKTQFEL